MRQGYDTNVYQVASETDSQRVSAHYSSARLGYELEASLSALSFYAEPRLEARWYPETSRANRYGGQVDLGADADWRHDRGGAKWFTRTVVELEVSSEYERELFQKRQTREEFRTGEPLDLTLRTDDMPSRWLAEAVLALRSYVRDAVTLEAAGFAEWVEYSDSSADAPGRFGVLGSREKGLLVAAGFNAGEVWKLDLEARWREKIYPEREAKDAEGERLEGIARRYIYWDFEVGTVLDAGWLRNEVVGEYGWRDDRPAGYYAYTDWQVRDRLRFQPLRVTRLELKLAYGEKRYESYAPAGQPIRNRYYDGRAALGLEITPQVELFLVSEYEQTRSNEPRLTFERVEVFAEVRVTR
ncbi:MAG: hypothetical protein GWN51_02905 [Gemmatimonadetes bacterium]|nr:hypothetical protein [Gemmatimonadota bacterium]NIT66018.1 hypothetical protein [Gemmatimonadota bacterium]NIV22599.1 hypothetical protein [Gemmatimonadota bacterium]NIW37677.1 hypothetical protein [Gemmatimonadota bacterium]NIY34596.1 hypothetical protein [Gemmatimonadota bacterium]